jgi:HSP20 family molecular chaperone IbpA
MQNLIENEVLTLENQKRIVLTSVLSVDGFSPENLKLTVNGKKVVITGNNIKITSFNKSSGDFRAEGDFVKISYEGKKVPVLKKIFK